MARGKGKKIRAAKLRESKAKSSIDTAEMKRRFKQKSQEQAIAIKIARSAAAERASKVESETRDRIERVRLARAAELAKYDAEWSRIVSDNQQGATNHDS